jgi:FMN phosphatase YigB (HAD superfamily)
MIDTILFDLDGTLLQFSQKTFIDAYFAELGKVFARLGMNVEGSVKAVWSGTKAMFLNDGSRTNHERFWVTFAECTGVTGDKLKAVEASCDAFYANEFDVIKSIITPTDIPKRLVHAMKAKRYNLVLATNPLFPACAVETRLGWIGLKPQDFSLVTNYSNSTYCKPNPGFYREVLKKINKQPRQCLMAGNSPVEDMSAESLGIESFLVTDYLENETGADITGFRQGSLEELERFLLLMPDVVMN